MALWGQGLGIYVHTSITYRSGGGDTKGIGDTGMPQVRCGRGLRPRDVAGRGDTPGLLRACSIS